MRLEARRGWAGSGRRRGGAKASSNGGAHGRLARGAGLAGGGCEARQLPRLAEQVASSAQARAVRHQLQQRRRQSLARPRLRREQHKAAARVQRAGPERRGRGGRGISVVRRRPYPGAQRRLHPRCLARRARHCGRRASGRLGHLVEKEDEDAAHVRLVGVQQLVKAKVATVAQPLHARSQVRAHAEAASHVRRKALRRRRRCLGRNGKQTARTDAHQQVAVHIPRRGQLGRQ